VLRRGFDSRRELWEWYRSVSMGRVDRRNGAIVVLDDSGEVVARIVFRGAWPCRWRLSALDALEPAVLMEEIELVVAEFQIE
jgi:phage tail-like protein